MRIQTVTLFLALFGTALLSGAQTGKEKGGDAIIMIAEEDSCAYVVEPGETLGAAMAQAAPLQNAQSAAEEEKGVCVQDELVHKPEGSVACKCYEHTECNGTESHTCKRHCRKDLCKCCSI